MTISTTANARVFFIQTIVSTFRKIELIGSLHYKLYLFLKFILLEPYELYQMSGLYSVDNMNNIYLTLSNWFK